MSPLVDALVAATAVVVFAVMTLGLTPSGTGTVSLPEDAVVRSIAEAAARGTVKVVARGCGVVSSASGTLVGPDLVMTNVHVIRGLPHLAVVDARGVHAASVTLLEPGLDLAILRASGLTGTPLRLSTRPLSRRTKGAVLGFPGGGALRWTPAAVSDPQPRLVALPSLEPALRRSVVQLQARVEQGNSGGPFVGVDGDVRGLVFSKNNAFEDVAFALGSDRLAQYVRRTQHLPAGAHNRRWTAC